MPGVRYICNVADSVTPTYSAAKLMIGFDNRATGVKSALCHGDDAGTIGATGFVALNSGTTAPHATGAGGTAPTFTYSPSDLAHSNCRQFYGPHYPSYNTPFAWTSSTFTPST